VDPEARVLVAAHAGWRGTANRVAAVAVRTAAELGAEPRRCHAAIGPCISQAGYQVGGEVVAALVDAGAGHCIVPDGSGRHLADLRAANVTHLVEAGLPLEHIIATSSSTDGGSTFFSDRAQRPCGRFALSARLATPSS
jgi:copper oxidase (laccase) domain-containing protein